MKFSHDNFPEVALEKHRNFRSVMNTSNRDLQKVAKVFVGQTAKRVGSSSASGREIQQ